VCGRDRRSSSRCCSANCEGGTEPSE
jgi:hypothetical protein